jgi:hypothetical protein
MALKIIKLHDDEDDCFMTVSVESEQSGVLVYCVNNHGDKTSMILDAQLFKQLCNEVSEAIKPRAQRINVCGGVSNATFA